MASVVTYQTAYDTDIEIDLCAACAATNRALGYPLGPVSRGQHDGTCEACEQRAIDIARSRAGRARPGSGLL